MIKLYKDVVAQVIIFDDGVTGTRPVNTIQAIGNLDGTVTILNKFSETPDGNQLIEYSNISFGEFVDYTDTVYGVDEASTVNAINGMFASTGGTGQLPSITSPLSLNSISGDIINYEMTSDFGVAYEWNNLPTGLSVVEGNIRKIIGTLPLGTYTPQMVARNYIGEDTETLTITVDNPPHSNVKSVIFHNSDYASASASTLNPLYRSSNGTGVSDAWTISCWFKCGTNTNSVQTIIMFGGSDQNNEGRIQIWYDGSYSDEHIRLKYGSDNNNLLFKTPDTGIQSGVWTHITVTYDGGTTGSSSGNTYDYYSRFNIFINGVSVSLSTSNDNNGWSGSIKDEYFRIGRNGTHNNYLRDCLIDELAIFNSDQSSNISDIYNSGVTHDLQLLANPPVHWYRMGDGDTFPTLQDNIGSADMTMYNMTLADIVSDVP